MIGVELEFPRKDVYEELQKAGLSLTDGCFRFDTLESAEDLELLFSVLENVKDKNGRLRL